MAHPIVDAQRAYRARTAHYVADRVKRVGVNRQTRRSHAYKLKLAEVAEKLAALLAAAEPAA